jgi:hypothetical protein
MLFQAENAFLLEVTCWALFVITPNDQVYVYKAVVLCLARSGAHQCELA